jgi:hypothetical protein
VKITLAYTLKHEKIHQCWYCKRLVIARGKGVVISSSENNTCLHTKASKDTSTLVETARSDFVASIARLFNFIALELKDGPLCSSFTGEAF